MKRCIESLTNSMTKNEVAQACLPLIVDAVSTMGECVVIILPACPL